MKARHRCCGRLNKSYKNKSLLRLKCEILSLNKRALCMQKCIPLGIFFVACRPCVLLFYSSRGHYEVLRFIDKIYESVVLGDHDCFLTKKTKTNMSVVVIRFWKFILFFCWQMFEISVVTFNLCEKNYSLFEIIYNY